MGNCYMRGRHERYLLVLSIEMQIMQMRLSGRHLSKYEWNLLPHSIHKLLLTSGKQSWHFNRLEAITTSAAPSTGPEHSFSLQLFTLLLSLRFLPNRARLSSEFLTLKLPQIPSSQDSAAFAKNRYWMSQHLAVDHLLEVHTQII